MTEEIQANRRKSEEKRRAGQHDVLLSYNRKDNDQVKNIEQMLMNNGIAPWSDEWDIRPGLLWMPELEQKIEEIKVAIIFIGKDGFGAWQKMERFALLSEFVERGCLIIPVILKNASSDMKLPPFLKIISAVDFRQRDPDPLEQLLYGITGKRPTKVYRPGVLIASLGDSPAVVPAMYDLLTQQRGLTLDRIVVMHPKGDDIREAYTLVYKTLSSDTFIKSEELKFEDADSREHSSSFLQSLYSLLCSYEQQGESVYLSLAGGRKSMAALMAWVVPFFSCIKGLYHVIDTEKDHFPSVNEIIHMPLARRTQAMRPKLDQLALVDIPWEGGQQISETLHKQLLGSLASDLARLEDSG
jgi:CRISPR-associated Csx14 family protein